jgi:hypothetical protein
LKTAKYGKRSTAGDILDSDDAKAELQAFLESIRFDGYIITYISYERNKIFILLRSFCPLVGMGVQEAPITTE